MACDLCGKKGVSLSTLKDIYKTKDVAEVCDACETIINKKLRKVQDFAFDLIPKLLKQYFKVYKPEPIAKEL